jgi:cell division septation protein DedD
MPVLIVLLCLLRPFEVSADPLVLHARQLEKSGDQEGAAKLLSAWLAGNPGATGSSSIFLTYMRLEQDLPALLDASGRYLQSAKGLPGAAGAFERIAQLFDLAGRIEDARNAYLSAHEEGAADSTLVSAFLLSLQMNDTDTMASTLAQMPGKGGSAELLLRALSEIRAGDRAAARTTLVGLADQTGNPDLSVKALWILYQTAHTGGDSAGEAAARSKLGARFSAAPETALASVPASAESSAPRPIVVQMPVPGTLDQGAALPGTGAVTPDSTPPKAAPAPAENPAPANSPAPGTAAPIAPQPSTPAVPTAPPSSPLNSVQAGSFLMKENADDLLAELAKRGFPAVVVRETIQGKDRYRVLAATGLDADAAKATLKKLSDAGFRGFLVQDK